MLIGDCWFRCSVAGVSCSLCAVGYYRRLVVLCCLLTVACCLLAVVCRCLLLVMCCVMCVLRAVCCVLCVLCVVLCVLCVVCCVMCVVYCVLRAVYCALCVAALRIACRVLVVCVLIAGCWSLVVVRRCVLRVACRFDDFDVRCVLFAVRYLLFVVCCVAC